MATQEKLNQPNPRISGEMTSSPQAHLIRESVIPRKKDKGLELAKLASKGRNKCKMSSMSSSNVYGNQQQLRFIKNPPEQPEHKPKKGCLRMLCS